MPVTLSTTAADTFKPSFAPSTNIGICLRSNGEEKVAVIDPFGFMVVAEVPTPASAPTCVAGPATGEMDVGQWVAYCVVYACSRRWPLVEGDSIGGNLYPRGNPSAASASFQVTSTASITISFPLPDNSAGGSGRTDINRVWIGRTQDFDTQAESDTAAAAGDFFYVDEYAIADGTTGGTGTYTDNYQTPTADLIEYDNYAAPQFQYCLFVDPYWWGFGNIQRPVAATWDDTGLVTFTDETFTFYSGRHQQSCYIKSATSDGDTTSLQRQYYAYTVIGNTNQCQLYKDLEGTEVTSFTAGSGFIVFAGPSTTLYRSKYRNPFAWGTTDYVGDIRVPSQFVFKVGGGEGTGLAQVPNMPLLVVSTKGPSATYTLDLRSAGDDTFGGTLRTISTLYSVTSHFSQFSGMIPAHTSPLMGTTISGSMLLFGHDGENFAITVTDGQSVMPYSDPSLTETLLSIATDPALLRMVHGLYDPQSHHNIMWLPTNQGGGTMDLAILHSATMGNWHTQFEGDVLSSAFVEATICTLRQIYVGTEKGNFGMGLLAGSTRNWIDPSVIPYGTFGETSQLSNAIPSGTVGVVGSFMLVCDSTGSGDQWGRIATIDGTGTVVTVDLVYSPTLGWGTAWFRTPVPGDSYYIGLIETAFLHYLDMGSFIDAKKLDEVWVALDGVDTNNPTFFQYLRDRIPSPLVLPSTSKILPLNQAVFGDGTPSQQWYNAAPPTERVKVFGLRIVDRGYGPWKMFGMGGKYS